MGCGSSVQVSDTSRQPPDSHNHYGNQNGYHNNRNDGMYHNDPVPQPAPQPYVPPRDPEPELGLDSEEEYDPEPEHIPTPEPEPAEPEPEREDSPEPCPAPVSPEPEPTPVPVPDPPAEPDVPNERREDDRRWRKNALEKKHDDSDLDGYDLVNVKTKGSHHRMGRTTVTIDTRVEQEDENCERPRVAPGELWEDPDFGEDVAFEGIDENVSYMRPRDLCEEPALFRDETTRFDIVQGRVGTCYFLSVIASLADKQDHLNQVFAADEYDPNSDQYDGVVHVRFWKFGKWKDVYVDDRIPVYTPHSPEEYKVWSASSVDSNELWVTMLEKAYAKEFGGSYSKIYGGTASDAFINLTGGVTERFDHSTDLKDTSVSSFFTRVNNALKSGSLVTCSCKEEKNDVKGMVGKHAYTLTGSGRVERRGKVEELFRIRNPWGSGEWCGTWSDDADEWQQVSESAKEALQVQGRSDGEFWMNMEDFFDNFGSTCICNFTPDFDQDGTQDNLDNVCSLLGEWQGETAAGSSDDAKFNNPKFEITVPEKGTSQVVIQCLQNKHKRLGDDFHFARVDLYSVAADLDSGYTVYDEITNYLSYQGGREVCYRYSLKPGKHIILPTTLEAGKERDFLIRTFSSEPLTCRQVKETPKYLIRKCDLEFDHNGITFSTPKIEYIPGAWRGQNAGGQISNDTFCNNPQYRLNVSGPVDVPLSILIMQDTSSKLALGYKLWKLDGYSLPLDKNTIYSIYNTAIKTTEGAGVFISSWEAEGTHLLEPGEYALLLFTDKHGDSKDFTLCLATSLECDVTHENYNQ